MSHQLGEVRATYRPRWIDLLTISGVYLLAAVLMFAWVAYFWLERGRLQGLDVLLLLLGGVLLAVAGWVIARQRRFLTHQITVYEHGFEYRAPDAWIDFSWRGVKAVTVYFRPVAGVRIDDFQGNWLGLGDIWRLDRQRGFYRTLVEAVTPLMLARWQAQLSQGKRTKLGVVASGAALRVSSAGVQIGDHDAAPWVLLRLRERQRWLGGGRLLTLQANAAGRWVAWARLTEAGTPNYFAIRALLQTYIAMNAPSPGAGG